MTTEPTFAGQERPVINPLFLFRWEETQDAYVLLYPEGVVKLNDTAGEILKRCDGVHTVGELVDEIAREFASDRQSIERSVHSFLEVSHAKGWIRRQA
jgi:pyrroloquinoline quinone biosynthesis protein D